MHFKRRDLFLLRRKMSGPRSAKKSARRFTSIKKPETSVSTAIAWSRMWKNIIIEIRHWMPTGFVCSVPMIIRFMTTSDKPIKVNMPRRRSFAEVTARPNVSSMGLLLLPQGLVKITMTKMISAIITTITISMRVMIHIITAGMAIMIESVSNVTSLVHLLRGKKKGTPKSPSF